MAREQALIGQRLTVRVRGASSPRKLLVRRQHALDQNHVPIFNGDENLAARAIAFGEQATACGFGKIGEPEAVRLQALRQPRAERHGDEGCRDHHNLLKSTRCGPTAPHTHERHMQGALGYMFDKSTQNITSRETRLINPHANLVASAPAIADPDNARPLPRAWRRRMGANQRLTSRDSPTLVAPPYHVR